MKREDAARLLGQPGRLSSVEKDSILERIEARRQSWFRRHRSVVMAATFAATAATVLIVVRPAGTSSSESSGTSAVGSSGLVARGRAELPLVIRCGEREPGRCEVGDRLAFDFGSAPSVGYVALFARSESGRVIWYVPSDEDTPSVPLATHTIAGVLDSVAVIDGTYEPGRYEVFAVVSPRSLQRAEIRAFAEGDRLVAPSDVHIETRTFVIRGEETSR